MTPGPGVLAQVLFADVRAPGPITSAIGWKVKEVVTAPGHVEPDRDLLVAVDAVGQAYSPDVELAAVGRSGEVPATLKQVRLEGDVVLTASFADAGMDRTGRASHAVHGLVHEGALVAADGTPRRPIELLDSPLWLRPVGEREVEQASVAGLGFDLPRGPVDLDALVGDAFLTDLDHAGRIEVLPVVLEAFRTALDQDLHLLLVVPDRDEVVGWLGLLQSLLDPVSAGRLRFSTREEVRSAAAVGRFDLQVAGVLSRPAGGGSGADARLSGLGDRFLVVDTAAPPPLRPDGGWELPVGGVLTRHEWTDIAEVVLSSPAAAHDVRAALDELAQLAPAAGRAPLWGLPVATVLAGVETIDREAWLRLVLRSWPAPGADGVGPEIVSTVRLVYDEQVDLDPDLAGVLVPSLAEGVPAELAGGSVTRWYEHLLSTPGAGPADVVLPRHALPAAARAELTGTLADRVGWLPGGAPVDQWPAAVRVWRLANAAGIDLPTVIAAIAPVTPAVVALLTDPAFDPIAAGWPTPPEPLWHELLRPELLAALHAGVPGTSPATHAWLDPVVSGDDRPEAAGTLGPIRLSAYGAVRAVALGSPADDRLAAVAVLGRAIEARRLHGLDLLPALRQALGQVFVERPVPFPAAAAVRDAVGGDLGAAVLVTAAAVRDARPGDEAAAFAQPVWDAVLSSGETWSGPDVTLLAVASQRDRLATGPVAAAEEALDDVHRLLSLYPEQLEPRAWHDAAAVALTAWGLRLPARSLQPPPPAAVEPTELGAVVTHWFAPWRPGPDLVAAGWEALAAANEADDVRAALAQLLVRSAVVDAYPGREAAEPFAAAFTAEVPDSVPFLRATVDARLAADDGPDALRADVQSVLTALTDAGWGASDVEAVGEAVEAVLVAGGPRAWRLPRGLRK